MKILHISDLHLSEDGKCYFSRESDFEKLLKDFSDGVQYRKIVVDAIVFSGDIVDKAMFGEDLSNLKHAVRVLELFGEFLNVPKERIFFLHGNHDFNAKIAEIDYRTAITDVTFATQGFGNIVGKRDSELSGAVSRFGSLHRLTDDAYVLMLDCYLPPTKKSEGRGPTKPTVGDVNRVVEMVNEHVKRTDTLIVVSHNPISDCMIIDSALDRIWTGGRDLSRRIAKQRDAELGASVWLSGDLHIQTFDVERLCDPPFVFCFGGFINNHGRYSNQSPSLSIVSIEHSQKKIEIQSVLLSSPDHEANPDRGEWVFSDAKSVPLLGRHAVDASVFSERKAIDDKVGDEIEITRDSKEEERRSRSPIVSLIENLGSDSDPWLSGSILRSISANGLYKCGRFSTSENMDALGWVSVGPLLLLGGQSDRRAGTAPLLPYLSDAAKKWVTFCADDRNEEGDIVLIGMDCWGTILASHISASSGWVNFCIAARGKGRSYSRFEKVSDRVIESIEKAQIVVFVSDVISTGNTIRQLYLELSEQVDEKGKEWWGLCVCFDPLANRNDSLSFLTRIGCACDELRIPIVDSKMLPDKTIFPSSIDFIDRVGG